MGSVPVVQDAGRQNSAVDLDLVFAETRIACATPPAPAQRAASRGPTALVPRDDVHERRCPPTGPGRADAPTAVEPPVNDESRCGACRRAAGAESDRWTAASGRAAGSGFSVWRGMAAPAGRGRSGGDGGLRCSRGRGAVMASALGSRLSALGSRLSALGSRLSALGSRLSALMMRATGPGRFCQAFFRAVHNFSPSAPFRPETVRASTKYVPLCAAVKVGTGRLFSTAVSTVRARASRPVRSFSTSSPAHFRSAP